MPGPSSTTRRAKVQHSLGTVQQEEKKERSYLTPLAERVSTDPGKPYGGAEHHPDVT